MTFGNVLKKPVVKKPPPIIQTLCPKNTDVNNFPVLVKSSVAITPVWEKIKDVQYAPKNHDAANAAPKGKLIFKSILLIV